MVSTWVEPGIHGPGRAVRSRCRRCSRSAGCCPSWCTGRPSGRPAPLPAVSSWLLRPALGGPPLHGDPVARRDEHRVVRRARVGSGPQHRPRLGPGSVVLLRGDMRGHGAVARPGSGDEVERVGGAPDVPAAADLVPGARAGVAGPGRRAARRRCRCRSTRPGRCPAAACEPGSEARLSTVAAEVGVEL